MDAYLTGLEKAAEAGHDLSKIHSVASFFVSRVDTEIDARLEKLGARMPVCGQGRRRQRRAGATRLRAGVRRLRSFARSSRGRPRAAPAVGIDRVKNPTTRTRCTSPSWSRQHGQHHAGEDPGSRRRPRQITGDTIEGTAAAAQAVFDELSAVGIDLDDVFNLLETEGVEKFEKSWRAARGHCRVNSDPRPNE
jgi:transaldolase